MMNLDFVFNLEHRQKVVVGHFFLIYNLSTKYIVQKFFLESIPG